MIFIKDLDGLYTADPETDSGAEFPQISVADLMALKLVTLPFDPILLDSMKRARLTKRIQIINGLVPGNLTCALNGEDV
jgi:molybdenum storage protein